MADHKLTLTEPEISVLELLFRMAIKYSACDSLEGDEAKAFWTLQEKVEKLTE